MRRHGPRKRGTCRPVVAVVGPTASGKSDLGVALAPRARRRGGQRRLDAALPRDGRRHREAHRGRARTGFRTTCSTSGRSPRRRAWRSTSGSRASVVDGAAGGGRSCRCSWAARGCTCARVLDDLEFPGTDPAVRARLEAELDAVGLGRDAPRGWPTSTRLRRSAILPDQRTPHRARARGRRDHRSAVHGDAARGARRLPERADRPRRAAARCSTRGSTSGSQRMWAAGLVEEVRRLLEHRSARRAHRVARARLRAGAPVPRRRVQRGGGARRDPARDPALRPPPGHLVPPRRPRPVAARTTPPTCSTARCAAAARALIRPSGRSRQLGLHSSARSSSILIGVRQAARSTCVTRGAVHVVLGAEDPR